jgi:hypothetical protein
MWLVSALRRRRYYRRYRSAWTLLLARYTYQTLSPEQQAAVRERDRQYLLACGNAWVFLRARSPRKYFSDYVIAMKSLGIPPALAGEKWQIPRDVEMQVVKPNRWGLLPRGRNKVLWYWSKLITNYRSFDPATEDARRDLASRGIQVPIIDPRTIDEVHHFDLGGKAVTWREWWLSQAVPGETGAADARHRSDSEMTKRQPVGT